MIIHQLAISNTDSAGFISVLDVDTENLMSFTDGWLAGNGLPYQANVA